MLNNIQLIWKGYEGMTDTELLKKKINENGYKVSFIAEKLGLTIQGFYNKINNKSGFYVTETAILKELLNLSDQEYSDIFFDVRVE